MRAAGKDLIPVVTSMPPLEAVGMFFVSNSPQSAQEVLWYLFKAWVHAPDKHRKKYSDEEIASFFDL